MTSIPITNALAQLYADVLLSSLVSGQALLWNGSKWVNGTPAQQNLTGVITSVGTVTSIASQTGLGSKFVVDTLPTLVSPNLGTPTVLIGTNITGTASGLTAGNVTTNASLTGVITSVGNATSIAAQTGTGTTFAMQASPSFTGVPLAPTAAPLTNTTQIATTAFVTAGIAAAVTGVLKFQGSTDCSSNPNYLAASKGDAYVVSAAGKIGGAAGLAVDIGDTYFATADNAGGTQAAVGASWAILEHNLQGALLAANNLSDVGNVNTALNTILPSQTGNNGKFLTTSGSNTSWATVTVPTAANPSALVALSAVNGSSASFMRADAAPALDQSIAPTWTGLHTFAAPAGTIKAIFKGGTSESVNLTEWRNSSNAVLAKVDAAGTIEIPGINQVWIAGYAGPYYNQIQQDASNKASLAITAGSPSSPGTPILQWSGLGNNNVTIFHTPYVGAGNALVIKASSSYSPATYLTQWQDSTGKILASVNFFGQFSAAGSNRGVQYNRDGIIDGSDWVHIGNTGLLHLRSPWDTTAAFFKPKLLIESLNTTPSTSWSTSGTGLGINAVSGFTGNLIDLQVGGISRLKSQATGLSIYKSDSGNGLSIYDSGGNLRTTFSGDGTVITLASGAASITATGGSLTIGTSNTSYIDCGILGTRMNQGGGSDSADTTGYILSRRGVGGAVTGASGYGFIARDDTNEYSQGQVQARWTGTAHASRTSAIELVTITAAVNSTVAIFGGQTSAALITAPSSTYIGLVVKGSTSQSADLFQAQNSSGTVLAKFSPAGVLTLGVASTQTGQAIFTGTTSGAVTLSVADAAGTWTCKLPTSAGTNGYVLQTDGSGNTSWVAVASGITVGTTTVTSGTSTRVLYDNAGVVGEYPITGTGNVMLSTSPTMVTPVLGTPSSGNLANCTGYPAVTSVATSAGVTGGTITTTGTISLDLTYSPTMTGVWTFTPTARSSGSAAYLSINGPADTNQTASTNAIGMNLGGGSVQHATGAITTQTDVVFNARTHTAVAASTITNLIGVDIPAPIVSTNVTATRIYGLRTARVIIPQASNGSNGNPAIEFTDTVNGPSGFLYSNLSSYIAITIGNIIPFFFNANGNLQLGSLTFTSNQDLLVGRVGRGILKITDDYGSTTTGWINYGGVQRVTADVTNATATPANITGATFPAIAGRKYVGYFLVWANNSTAAEGLAFNFAGTATVTDIKFGFAGNPCGTTVGTAYSNAAATPITVTTATTGDIAYMIAFEFVCNAAGTVQLQGAEVSHTLGTAIFRAGSFFTVNDSPT
jgi:hypothetical protein